MRISPLVSLLALTVSSLGCEKDLQLYEPHTVERQEDAAMVTLGVTAVAPWDDYQDELKPDFKIESGDTALKKVLPKTTFLEDKVWQALGAGLEIDADPNGDPEPVDSGIEKAEGKLPGLRSGNSGPTTDNIGQDPSLAYLAATGLFQEVKLLNKYIENSPEIRDHDRYLVRLQIGVTPFARNQPYDVYTRLVFLPSLVEQKLKPEAVKRMNADLQFNKLDCDAVLADASASEGDGLKKTKEEEECDELRGDLQSAMTGLNATPKSGTEPQPGGTDKPDTTTTETITAAVEETKADTVVVVPLLVTDNIEAALKSRAIDQVRQLSIALAAAFKGVSAKGGITSYAEKMNSILGADLNSLFTIGQLAPNAIQVRLGAARQASAEYAMVPRTHNVTVLVLVPKDASQPAPALVKGLLLEPKKILVEAATELRHAKDGTPLARREPDYMAQRAKTAMKNYADNLWAFDASRDTADSCLNNLSASMWSIKLWVMRGNFLRFQQRIAVDCGSNLGAASLWLELLQIYRGGPYQSAEIHLPRPSGSSEEYNLTDFAIKMGSQVIRASNDGKGSTSLGLVLSKVPKDHWFRAKVEILGADVLGVSNVSAGVSTQLVPGGVDLEVKGDTVREIVLGLGLANLSEQNPVSIVTTQVNQNGIPIGHSERKELKVENETQPPAK